MQFQAVQMPSCRPAIGGILYQAGTQLLANSRPRINRVERSERGRCTTAEQSPRYRYGIVAWCLSLLRDARYPQPSQVWLFKEEADVIVNVDVVMMVMVLILFEAAYLVPCLSVQSVHM